MDVTPVANEAIPSFTRDTFQERRNNSPSAGVPYDPESLVTGSEEASGLTYRDKRAWATRQDYIDAVAGLHTPEWIAKNAPRIKGNREVLFLEDSGKVKGTDSGTTERHDLPPGIILISLEDLCSGRVQL